MILDKKEITITLMRIVMANGRPYIRPIIWAGATTATEEEIQEWLRKSPIQLWEMKCSEETKL